jgi:hypothetical protein
LDSATPRSNNNSPSSTGGNGKVAFLWDIENCQVPRKVNVEDVVGNIQYAL